MSGDGDNRPRQPLVDDLSLDDFLPYLLNRISNRLNIDLAEDLREIGVTPQYWRVLAVLHVTEGRSIGELSVYTITEQSTLSRIVDRMAQAGLVERRASPEDARVAEVHLTTAGRETFDRILPVAIGHYRRATAGLDEAEHRNLVDSLHKVLDTIRTTPYP
jgi:DNA-binding MarR family transcriptional regulator